MKGIRGCSEFTPKKGTALQPIVYGVVGVSPTRGLGAKPPTTRGFGGSNPQKWLRPKEVTPNG